MSWATRLRTAAGLWLSPVMVLLVLAHLNQDTGRGYGLARATVALANTALLAGLVAVAAAWEGSRLRRGRVPAAMRRRRSLRVLAAPLVWSLLPAIVVCAAEFARRHVLTDPSGMQLAVLAAGVMVAWAGVGTAFGLWLPRAAALPLALIVPTAWVALTPASGMPGLRYLAGYFVDCCTLSESLDPRAIHGFVIVQASLAVTGLVLSLLGLSPARRTIVRGLAALVVLCGLAGAAVAHSHVSGMGFRPVVDRSDPPVCRSISGLGVCVAPEHADILTDAEPTVVTIVQAWRAKGITLPARLSEIATGTTPANLVLPTTSDPLDVAVSLSSAVAWSPCTLTTETVPVEVQMRQERVEAFLAVTAAAATGQQRRLDRTSMALGPEAWAWASDLSKLTGGQQTVKINRELANLTTCR